MKDNVYIGKVGNKYLKGKTLVKSVSSADVFESETEPKQRLNQMKKKGIIPKDSKIKILCKKDENAFDKFERNKLDKAVSSKDKWNLKMDIESLKKELVDSQNTAADLPDNYVKEICRSENYPFEDAIDDDIELNLWCDETEAFLNDSLNIKEENMRRGNILKESESQDGGRMDYLNDLKNALEEATYPAVWEDEDPDYPSGLKNKVLKVSTDCGDFRFDYVPGEWIYIVDFSGPNREFTVTDLQYPEDVVALVEKTVQEVIDDDVVY